MAVEERKFLWSNFARSTLAEKVSSSTTTLRVQPEAAALFPSPGDDEIFSLALWDADLEHYEVVYCTKRAGAELTVERGKEATTARAFAAGALVVHQATAGFFEQLATPEPPTITITLGTNGDLVGYSTDEDDSFGSASPSPPKVGSATLTDALDTGGSFRLIFDVAVSSVTGVTVQTDDGSAELSFDDAIVVNSGGVIYHWSTSFWSGAGHDWGSSSVGETRTLVFS